MSGRKNHAFACGDGSCTITNRTDTETRDRRKYKTADGLNVGSVAVLYLHIAVLGNGRVREGAETDARHTERAARASLVELRAAAGVRTSETRKRKKERQRKLRQSEKRL